MKNKSGIDRLIKELEAYRICVESRRFHDIENMGALDLIIEHAKAKELQAQEREREKDIVKAIIEDVKKSDLSGLNKCKMYALLAKYERGIK